MNTTTLLSSRSVRATGLVSATVLALSVLGGCAGMSQREQNTAIGAGVGAAGGAVLTGGSAVGTVGGAAIGGLIGNQVDTNKK